MIEKILKLTPIKLTSSTKEANENTNRIITISKIEVKFSEDNFIVNSPMGEIILEEDDQLLLDKILLRVNFKYVSNDEYYNSSSAIEEDIEEESFTHSLNEKNIKNHPLAFLFESHHPEE